MVTGKKQEIKKYYLVFQENIHYCCLWAFKFYAITINIINLIMNLIGIYLTYKLNLTNVRFEIWIAIIIIGTLFLFIWIFFINQKWVRYSAYAYARV
ncbi:MAG: hypothetical protein K0Q87_5089 [Neobacillus sp.]|jgi:hypothetical protein|nr:hypothetical protein [Neobacillus sp.]